MAAVLSCAGLNYESKPSVEGIARRTADTTHFYEDIKTELWGTVHKPTPEVSLAGR